MILFCDPGKVKPEGKDLARDVFTLVALVMETLSEIEENQIRGIVYVFNVGGFSLKHLNVVPADEWMKVGKNGEKALAAKHVQFHLVNMSTALQFALNLAIRGMKETLQNRVNVYSSFDELDFIDKNCLPLEHGGKIPMSEMTKELWNLMIEKRPIHLKYKEMHVKENMYPKACLDGSVEMLKVPLNSPDLFDQAKNCCDDMIYGVQGSFRKLEID
jgi:hypothetical protein